MRGGWRMAAPSRSHDPRTFLGAQSGGNDLVQQERRQGRSSPNCSSSTQQIFTAAGAALQRSTYWKRSCSATRHARTMIPGARSSSEQRFWQLSRFPRHLRGGMSSRQTLFYDSVNFGHASRRVNWVGHRYVIYARRHGCCAFF